MNYLLSYPRSGNTWLRYALEVLTGKRSIGYLNSNDFDKSILLENRTKEIFMIKRHDTKDIENVKNNKVILLLRDYNDVLVRHKGGKFTIKDDHNSNTEVGYLKLIDFCEGFVGDKLVIYYEDLLTDLESQLTKCNEFLELDVPESDITNFMSNLATHKQKSINRYGNSVTKGNVNIKHSRIFTDSEILENVEWLKTNKGVIFDKYLKRYER